MNKTMNKTNMTPTITMTQCPKLILYRLLKDVTCRQCNNDALYILIPDTELESMEDTDAQPTKTLPTISPRTSNLV